MVSVGVLITGILLFYIHKSNCISATQARSHIGQHKCIEYKVGYTYTSWRGNTFLDQYQAYRNGFSVYIPDGSGLSSNTARSYLGKTIDVTGTITLYKGEPEIEVADPSQVKLAQ